jgi:hypothetical protein
MAGSITREESMSATPMPVTVGLGADQYGNEDHLAMQLTPDSMARLIRQ